mmetsp:Transcript_15861/g.24023  ORF Transcript_15861/g.24023 Transcript_15861/m.24023 type:complete len:329 (+) Transcript_15861:138-1124(+)
MRAKGKKNAKHRTGFTSVVFLLLMVFVHQLYFKGDLEKEADYSLAKRQSLGFFNDITSTDWKRLQKKVLKMAPNFCDWMMAEKKFSNFFQCHYEPDFVCQHEQRIGMQGDGGKWICDPHRIAEKVEEGGSCLVYSVGSHNDFSFEQGIHKDIHKDCDVHTFDFGDFADGAKKAGGKILYHQWGLGVDTTDGKGNVFKSMSTTLEELGHQNKVIDIFKIDCEECEWDTAVSWFEAATKHNVLIRQIQVELHRNQAEKVHAFFDLMYEHGYVIIHKEINIIAMEKYKAGMIEYAFLKLDPRFVNAAPRTKGVDVLKNKAKQGTAEGEKRF